MSKLHLVFGGEMKDLDGGEFRDLSKVDFVGAFPDYASAQAAWKAKAQATVDSAQTRYFIVHLHRLLDPNAGLKRCPAWNLSEFSDARIVGAVPRRRDHRRDF